VAVPQPSLAALNFAWLVRLRWAAIAAQALTVLVVHRVMNVALPLAPLACIIGLAAASNVACAAWTRRPRTRVAERHLGAVMILDVLVLSALLYESGGPFNPFSFLYLVQIALAAVVLPPRWTWLLVALSLACSAFLFVDHRQLVLPATTHDEHMRWHLWGMWVAFGVAAAFIVYFLMRVLRSLAAREAELRTARAHVDRQERLASLATLAGGAAHELATPLSTIATVARELERRLGRDAAAADPDVLDDLRLLRSQVERCRAILDQMSAHAGESAGEGLAPTTLAELARAATVDLATRAPVRVEVGDDARAFALPPRALAQALRVLVANAQDASPDGAEVLLRASAAVAELRLEVRDRGAGMAPEVLARVGEPFYTTKAPGHGMGLGIFLSRAVIERLGGELSFESSPGGGTVARVRLPVQAEGAAAAASATTAPATNGRIAASGARVVS
jgi:two-component system sensor histidine kinase RegB